MSLISKVLFLFLYVCIVMGVCSLVVFVRFDVTLLLFCWFISVWFFEVSLMVAFMLRMLLILLKSLIIPHTRVCGLS